MSERDLLLGKVHKLVAELYHRQGTKPDAKLAECLQTYDADLQFLHDKVHDHDFSTKYFQSAVSREWYRLRSPFWAAEE